jgi:interferon-induced GTP-binding protein Mx1
MRRHGVDSQGNQQEMTTLIQAYWDIASRRFIDNVCMCIEKEFVSTLVNEVETQGTLLGISMSDTEVKHLMKEDDQVSFRRNELIEKVKVLQASIDVLNQYLHR